MFTRVWGFVHKKCLHLRRCPQTPNRHGIGCIRSSSGAAPRSCSVVLHCPWIHARRLQPGALRLEKGYVPVVPPKKNRLEPWAYDKELYKQRNEIERFFLRLKRFRRIFVWYDKLDILFVGFILFAMIVDPVL